MQEYIDLLLAKMRRNFLAIAFSFAIAIQDSGEGSLVMRSRPVIVQYGVPPVYMRKRQVKNHRVFTATQLGRK